MTWEKLDEYCSNELQSLVDESVDDWEDIKDELIWRCAALESAMQCLIATAEYTDEPAVMHDLTIAATEVQKVAKRTTGAFYWPFVTTLATA